jgi:hypothetical protein
MLGGLWRHGVEAAINGCRSFSGAFLARRQFQNVLMERAMTSWKRFWIGGGGALLPVLVTLYALDLSSMIDHYKDYSIGTYVGTGLRYSFLFVIGGFFAALNYDEVKPVKLVQLGVAAPALIATWANPVAIAKQTPNQTAAAFSWNISYALDLISSARAGEVSDRPIVVAGFFSDVLLGLRGPAAIQRNANEAAAEQGQQGTQEQGTAATQQETKPDLHARIFALSVAAQKSAAAAEAALQKAKADAAAAAAEAADRITPQLKAAAKQSAALAEAAANKAAEDAKAVRDAAVALQQRFAPTK